MARAIGFVFLVVFLFLFLLVAAPLPAFHLLICTILAVTRKRGSHGQRYGIEVFTAYDQLMNVLFAPVLRWLFRYPCYDFGYADETISSVIGKNILKAPQFSDKSLFIVNGWLTKIDPYSKNHSVDSIEYDEGDQI